MNIEYAKAIVAAMGDDWDEDETPRVRPDYSGRGMYGKTTAAVECLDIACFIEAACNVAMGKGHPEDDDNNPDEFCREMGKVKIDSMGRDSIVVY